MKALKLITLIMLVLAFGAVTLGSKENVSIYDLTNILSQWGDVFTSIENGYTGIALIDTLLKWKPLRFIASTITFFAFAGSFAITLFTYWWS